jgi:hypothetical protein
VFHLHVAIVDLECCYDNIHMLQAYVLSVLGVFRRILQMFHLDVSKVDLGVAHVAMLYTHVLSVVCFRRML